MQRQLVELNNKEVHEIFTNSEKRRLIKGLRSFDILVTKEEMDMIIDNLFKCLELVNQMLMITHDTDLKKNQKIERIVKLRDPLGRKFISKSNANKIYMALKYVPIEQGGGFLLWPLEQEKYTGGFAIWITLILDIVAVVLEVVGIGLDIFSFTGFGAVAQLIPDVLSIILAILRLDFITVILNIIGMIPYVGMVGDIAATGWKGFKILRIIYRIGSKLL